MEVESMMPLCDIGSSQDKVSSWLDDSDVSALLNMEETSSPLDLQNVPSASPQYLGLNDSPLASPFTPPYSSPELPDMDSSFVAMEAPPLFDAQLIEMDMLFADSLADVNPELLPELERILSSVDTSISPPASPSDQVPPTRSTKKRKTEEAADGVCLPRDQLLTMTSTEIEDYVCKLKSQRTLSAAEEKELKRQRRLIKNREYASQSRSRKKQYVDELEKQLEEVRAENSSLKQHNSTLAEENKVLKKQIAAIATTIKKSSASLNNSTSGMSTLSKLTSVGAGRTQNTKTVSACLLAIMLMAFTFSILDSKPLWEAPISRGAPLQFNRKLLEFNSSCDQDETVADVSGVYGIACWVYPAFEFCFIPSTENCTTNKPQVTSTTPKSTNLESSHKAAPAPTTAPLPPTTASVPTTTSNMIKHSGLEIMVDQQICSLTENQSPLCAVCHLSSTA